MNHFQPLRHFPEILTGSGFQRFIILQNKAFLSILVTVKLTKKVIYLTAHKQLINILIFLNQRIFKP